MAMRRKTGKKTRKYSSSTRDPMTDKLETRKEAMRILLEAGESAQVIKLMKQSKDHMVMVGELLSDDVVGVPISAALELEFIAQEGIDISDVVPDLVKALSDENIFVGLAAAGALKNAAAHGIDISEAIPVLINTLDIMEEDFGDKIAKILWNITKHRNEISKRIESFGNDLSDETDDNRIRAARILGNAASGGFDISNNFEKLVNGLCDDEDIWQWAAFALKKAAENGTQQTREKILSELMKFMNSDWFKREAERNSIAYVIMMGRLDEIMRNIAQNERGAA